MLAFHLSCAVFNYTRNRIGLKVRIVSVKQLNARHLTA
ncbi:hypothetical protein PSPO_a2628 [Pseudoalteromonas spongiae UST010723-006]|nr:hypothetical protein PSPO_a2628 [Pseudoalteromonas spongiae UST010723-006]